MIERNREQYAAEDHRRVEDRIRLWADRSPPGPEHDLTAARQRRHRVREAVRPHEPARPGTDPWALGARALEICSSRLRLALKGNGVNNARMADLRELEEIVRRLSWGPD